MWLETTGILLSILYSVQVSLNILNLILLSVVSFQHYFNLRDLLNKREFESTLQSVVPFVSQLFWYQRQDKAKMIWNTVKQLSGQLLWDCMGHGRNCFAVWMNTWCGVHKMTQQCLLWHLPSSEEQGVLWLTLFKWKKPGNMKADANISNAFSCCLGENNWFPGTLMQSREELLERQGVSG